MYDLYYESMEETAPHGGVLIFYDVIFFKTDLSQASQHVTILNKKKWYILVKLFWFLIVDM